jgi:hypothetical protein
MPRLPTLQVVGKGADSHRPKNSGVRSNVPLHLNHSPSAANWLRGSGKAEQGNLRPGIQAYRSERGPDTATYVEMGVFNPVQPLRIAGQQVGQAEIQTRQGELDLATMIMARQGERHPVRRG